MNANQQSKEPTGWTYSQEQLQAMGYVAFKNMPDGSQAALIPLLYTVALVHGLTPHGYEDRWCYSSMEKALKAMEQWDGEGEPTGWHRHPSTGRRVDEAGNITINY